MSDHPTPEELRFLREIVEEGETERAAHAPSVDAAAAARFDDRATAMFQAYHARHAGEAARPGRHGSAPSPWRRFRAFWTPLRVSFAANIGFVALAVLAATNRPYLSPLTTRTMVEGSTVTVFDARFDNKLIWSHDFENPVRFVRTAPWNGGKRYIAVSVRDDIIGVAYFALWDFREDAEVWTHEFRKEELLPLFPPEMASAGIMYCMDVDFPDLEGDGEPEIAAMFRQSIYLPACVRTLNRQGEVLGTYFNWGYLEDVLAADLDNDGRDEILAAGTNNAPAYQGATVILLDRDHLSGASADDQVWADAGVEDGSLARVVFPHFDREMQRLLDVTRLHGWGLKVDWSAGPASPVISLSVGAGGADIPHSTAYVLPYLDRTLRPMRVVVCDVMPHYARRWIEEGLTTRDLSAPEFGQEWLSRALYFGKLPPLPPAS